MPGLRLILRQLFDAAAGLEEAPAEEGDEEADDRSEEELIIEHGLEAERCFLSERGGRSLRAELRDER